MPSTQLTEYLQLRADGETVEHAAELSTIGLTEARLWERDIESGEVELPRARARTREEETMDDVTTSIRVNDGPEVPIDLEKDLDAPENAEAKEAITGFVRDAVAKPATDTGQRLKLFIERVERLKEEIKGLNEDVSSVYQEAKSGGFDTATMKRIVKLRKMGDAERQEAEALLSTYMDAIGMTPIEQAIALAA